MEVRAISARRSARRARSSSRRGVNSRCSSATKARAASVRTSSCRGRGSASTMASGDGAGADMSCHFLQRQRAAGSGDRVPWRAGIRATRGPAPGDRRASEQWILVSSLWKFNGLLMSRFSGSTQAWRSVPGPHAPFSLVKVLQVGLGVDVVGIGHIAALHERDAPARAPSGRRAPRGPRPRSPRSPPSGPRRTGPDARAPRRTRPPPATPPTGTRRRAPGPPPAPRCPAGPPASTSAADAPVPASEPRPARSDEPMPSSQAGFSTSTHPVRSARARTSSAAAPSTTWTRSQPPARSTATACSTRGRPRCVSSAFGRPPSLRPPPAASSSPVTGASSVAVS